MRDTYDRLLAPVRAAIGESGFTAAVAAGQAATPRWGRLARAVRSLRRGLRPAHA